MKRIDLLLYCILFLVLTGMPVFGQDTGEIERQTEKPTSETNWMRYWQLSGYIQGQFQYGEKDASLGVGSENENRNKDFNRLGIRRGRIKLTYEESLASAVFQIDITEKGLGVKDAYFTVKDPWKKIFALRVGAFDRPFGNEISYSSSRRESPERSAVFRTLFPDERDLGAMLVLQAPESSPFSFLKLEAGLFAGNGIEQETDNRKDFIGHLSTAKSFRHVAVSGGISYYRGGVYQGTENVYKMKGAGFLRDENADNVGKQAKREYFGVDAQVSFDSGIGGTHVRGEYLWGTQPGTLESSKSPNSSALPSADVYIRPFMGWYAILIQDIGASPFSAVVKYDYYDANTDTSGNAIGEYDTSPTDLRQSSLGVGALWRITDSMRLQAFYEIKCNETTDKVVGWDSDRSDNVFTLRMQYKF